MDITEHRQQVEEAVSFLSQKISTPPEVVIILGTGLSSLAESLIEPLSIPYEEIPHFPVSTVTSHEGNLVFGSISGKSVAILQGRVHCYEGYSAREVAFPVRVLSLLGATMTIVTNASGGLNSNFQAGSIMVLTDHINLQGDNPLRGPNIDEWGPRFPDLSKPYDLVMIENAKEAARVIDFNKLVTGTYVCIPGPSLETSAETKFLRKSGADAVGMSSLPEIVVATHAGMRVLGLSVIANVNDPNNLQPILLEDIIQTARESEPILQNLVAEIVSRC